MGTIIICLILAVICIFAVRSYVKKLRSGCCGAGEDPVKSVRPSDRDLSHYPYSCKIVIEGMSAKTVPNGWRTNSTKGTATMPAWISKRTVPLYI